MSTTKTTVLVPLIILLALIAFNSSCMYLSSQGIGGDWNPSALYSGKTIISTDASFTTTIANIECVIEANLLLNYHLNSEPNWSSYIAEGPLTGAITIRSVYANSIPGSWVIEDEVIITNNDGDSWVTEFADKDTHIGLPVWECSIRGGPQWEAGTTASVTFRISTWYLTAAERVDETYTCVVNNVPILGCRCY